METLGNYGINLEVVQDSEWLEVANAVCDPDPKVSTIVVPDKLYTRICERDPIPFSFCFMKLDILF